MSRWAISTRVDVQPLIHLLMLRLMRAIAQVAVSMCSSLQRVVFPYSLLLRLCARCGNRVGGEVWVAGALRANSCWSPAGPYATSSMGCSMVVKWSGVR
jgi:hypothetical protein